MPNRGCLDDEDAENRTLLARRLSKPHEAIEKLGPIDDPMIGVCVHWFYGPHTTDGVVGKDNPLLLASNFSGRWPGLVGLLNTGACLESLNRPFSRAWTEASDWTTDHVFMERLDEWCTTGKIRYAENEVSYQAPVSVESSLIAREVADEIRKRRILVLMLGDTSMGMINGYSGPRLLNRHGFTEHKIDQAWIIDRGVATSTRWRHGNNAATTWRCSTWSTSTRPIASAGSTNSD